MNPHLRLPGPRHVGEEGPGRHGLVQERHGHLHVAGCMVDPVRVDQPAAPLLAPTCSRPAYSPRELRTASDPLVRGILGHIVAWAHSQKTSCAGVASSNIMADMQSIV